MFKKATFCALLALMSTALEAGALQRGMQSTRRAWTQMRGARPSGTMQQSSARETLMTQPARQAQVALEAEFAAPAMKQQPGGYAGYTRFAPVRLQSLRQEQAMPARSYQTRMQQQTMMPSLQQQAMVGPTAALSGMQRRGFQSSAPRQGFFDWAKAKLGMGERRLKDTIEQYKMSGAIPSKEESDAYRQQIEWVKNNQPDQYEQQESIVLHPCDNFHSFTIGTYVDKYGKIRNVDLLVKFGVYIVNERIYNQDFQKWKIILHAIDPHDRFLGSANLEIADLTFPKQASIDIDDIKKKSYHAAQKVWEIWMNELRLKQPFTMTDPRIKKAYTINGPELIRNQSSHIKDQVMDIFFHKEFPEGTNLQIATPGSSPGTGHILKDVHTYYDALKKYKFTPYEALGLPEDASHEEFSRRFWYLWDYSQPRAIGRTQEENEKARYIHERLEHIKEQMKPDEKYHIKV